MYDSFRRLNANINKKEMTFVITPLNEKKEVVFVEKPAMDVSEFVSRETEKAICLEFTVEFVIADFEKKISVWFPKSWKLNAKTIKSKIADKIEELGFNKYGESLTHGIDL